MRIIQLILILLIATLTRAQALYPDEPTVRVRIINTLDTLDLETLGHWTARFNTNHLQLTDGGKIRITVDGNQLHVNTEDSVQLPLIHNLQLSSPQDSNQIKIVNVPYGLGWWWGGQEDRFYSGTLHIYPNEDGHISVTVHLPLETYLKGVVPYEIGPESPMEALKAQAVAARSEAVIALNSGMYGGYQHDLTSDVECQVFSGNKRRSAASDAAVAATRGLVLAEQGEVIHAFYASNCGGRAEKIENVWPGRNRSRSYQVSHYDRTIRRGLNLKHNIWARLWINRSPRVYCNPQRNPGLPSWSQRNFRWERSFSITEISNMLAPDSSFGSLKKIKVLKRGESGRITHARFIFEHGQFEESGELRIRQLFAPSLRSSNFYASRKGELYILHGAGWGHGVGMCQTGAIAQAITGVTYKQILRHYYPASSLLDIYSTTKSR